MVLPPKMIFCMGGSTQLGPVPLEGQQCHSHPASFSSLPEGYYLHRGRLFAQQGQPLHCDCATSLHPLITGGPYLVQPDNQCQVTVAVINCSPVDLEVQRNDLLAASKMSKTVKPGRSTWLTSRLWPSKERSHGLAKC